MSRHARNTRRRAQRPSGGFTLVELLIVVTIIALLATMVLAAVHMARESARELKTKSTITKLHGILMDRYESFRTRRVSLALYSAKSGATPVEWMSSWNHHTLTATRSTPTAARSSSDSLSWARLAFSSQRGSDTPFWS